MFKVQRTRRKRIPEFNDLNEQTPEGTAVRVHLDNGDVKITKTRSKPWKLCRDLVVLLEDRSGGYLASRCEIVRAEELDR